MSRYDRRIMLAAAAPRRHRRLPGTPHEAIPRVFAEGQVLDNTYRVVRLIGEGGMGLVYEAAHARLAGRYAIKVLLRKLSENPDALARFNREARITSSLQHPNIVQVIDFNTHTDGTEYLVMEYLHGETLAERLARRGALPLDMVVSIVEQVAAGLAAAHAHAVVHRDLKPDNVFLVPIEGRQHELAKVLDFGISKARDVNHGLRGPESALMGTPQYMSPEQCQGRTGVVNATTDQFALAVITYEMLTGQPPFCGDSVGTVLSQVIYADPPPMNLDPEIEAVVRRGLAKSGADRFPSVTAFAAALRAAVAARIAVGTQTDDALSGAVGGGAAVRWEASSVGSDDLAHLGYDPTLRGKPRDNARGAGNARRGGRRWGALALAAGAVAVTMFFVVGANSVERARSGGMLLPPPVVPREKIVDLTLEPPKLPSLTTTVVTPGQPDAPTPADPKEDVATEAPRAAAGPTPPRITTVSKGESSASRLAAETRAAMERRQLEQWQFELREIQRREAERGDLERVKAKNDSHPADRHPATAATGGPQSGGGASSRPSRASPALDEDAILPLDESIGSR